MKKKPTLKRLKKDAWKLMSEYIRRRWAGRNGLINCFTCGKRGHWKTMQAGHFRHGHHMDYEFLNLQAQCPQCNKWRSGRLDVYATRLVEKYGHEILEELEYKAHQVGKHDRSFFENKIDELKNKLNGL